jgi:GT2 family glycosyltransferase
MPEDVRPTPSPHVSVVVPTCNRSERVLRLLDALSAQDLTGSFEVVVVDDASHDDTVARLHSRSPEPRFSLVVVETADNAGPAAARNRGWRRARGGVIAFVDDDCVPDPSWLRALVDCLVESDIAVGRTRPPADQLHLIGPFSSYLDIDHNGSFSTCNIAYRRDVLEATGGFDQDRFTWPNGEDTDLGLRARQAGYCDAYASEALVWHDVGVSEFRANCSRARRLDGLVALIAAHPEARDLMHAGWFLRSVDKAVLLAWVAGAGLLLRPRPMESRVMAGLAAAIYVWQFRKCHYDARSAREAVTSIPLGFVADSWAVMVLIRSSVRHRTLLL